MTDQAIAIQIEILEALIRKRWQEQLEQDQADITLGLSGDQPGPLERLVLPIEGNE